MNKWWVIFVVIMSGLLARSVFAALPDCRDYANIELAVLNGSDNPGSILDLAYCQLLLGEPKSALSLLDKIEADFFPPEPVREIIAVLRNKALAELHTSEIKDDLNSQFYASLDFLIGRENNLNLGPTTSVATLTLPTGVTEFPLDSGTRPRSGDAFALQMRLAHVTPLLREEGDQFRQWEWIADLRHRSAFQDSSANYWQAAVGGGLHYRDEKGLDTIISVNSQQAAAQGQSLLSLQQIQWGRDIPVRFLHERFSDSCRVTGGLSYEWRSYSAQSILNGRALIAGLGGYCTLFDRYRVGAGVRYGTDKPLYDRPGGDQVKQEIFAYWDGLVILGGKAQLLLQASSQRDRLGYSELLENGAKRVLHRRLQRLEWEKSWFGPWSWLVVVEQQQQQANLNLFVWEVASLYAGVRYIWR